MYILRFTHSVIGYVLIFFYGVLVFLLVFGLMANGLLIYSVLRKASLRRSPTYVTLVSLATSDICSLMTSSVMLTMMSTTGPSLFSCTLFLFASVTATCSCAHHLVAFSVLRYVILVKPIFSRKYLSKSKTAIIACVLIWTESLAFSSLVVPYTYIMSFNATNNTTVSLCSLQPSAASFFLSTVIVVGFVPMALIAVFHIAKVCQLRKRIVRPLESQGSQVSIKVVVGILISFGVASLPNSIYWLLFMVRNELSLDIVALGYVLSSFTYINNAIDPLFYFFFSKRLRRDICCRCRQNDDVDLPDTELTHFPGNPPQHQRPL